MPLDDAKFIIKTLEQQAECYTKVIVGYAKREDMFEWKAAQLIRKLLCKTTKRSSRSGGARS